MIDTEMTTLSYRGLVPNRRIARDRDRDLRTRDSVIVIPARHMQVGLVSKWYFLPWDRRPCLSICRGQIAQLLSIEFAIWNNTGVLSGRDAQPTIRKILIFFAVILAILSPALLSTPALSQPLQPQLVIQNGHTSDVYSVAFSPNGKTIASASVDGTIKLWDTATGQLLRTLQGHTSNVNSIAFSPDGKTIVSASSDATIKIWDIATGDVLRSIDAQGPVDAVAFSPDGKSIATGSSHNPQHSVTFVGGAPEADTVPPPPDTGYAVKLWDTATGNLLRTFTGHTGDVRSVAFSPDGTTIASGSDDNTIRLWNTATGQLLHTLTGHTASVDSVAFSPDGKTIVSGSDDNSLKLWDPSQGTLLRTLTGHTSDVYSVAFSPDGKTIASGSADQTIDLWNPATGHIVRTMGGDDEEVKCVNFSPDSKTLATGNYASTVILWNTASGNEIRTLNGTVSQTNAIKFSPNGKTIAASAYDGTVHLWDITVGSQTQILKGDRMYADHIAFSPDGGKIAGNSSDKSVSLWDIGTGRTLQTFTIPSTVVSMAFSPNGKTLAICSQDNSLRFWNTSTGSLLRTLTTKSTWNDFVSYSSDGKTFASGIDDSTLTVWDTATNAVLRTLTGDYRMDDTVAISPNGKVFASANYDRTVEMYDAVNGRLLHTLPASGKLITFLSFSTDNKVLISGSKDAIDLWDVATGTLRQTINEGVAGASTLALTLDFRYLFTGSFDGSIKLWDTITGKELASLYAFGDTDWAVVTPDGRFDTGNLDNIQNIHWVLPDQPFTPVPVEAFFAQYYTPGLLPHILNHDPLPDLPDIANINHVQPAVTIEAVKPHPGSDPSLVDVTVSYATQQADALQPDGSTKSEVSGVYDLHLFRNGQLVASLPENPAPGALPKDLSGSAAGTSSHTFTIRLPRDGAKSIRFTAYAFNSDRVKSQTASIDYTLPKPLPAVHGRAWVIAFGVNAYSDPHWNLHYAAADARAFGELLTPRLTKTEQYSKVTFVPMISDTENQGHAGVHALEPDILPATKEALHAVLDVLAGKSADIHTARFTSILQKLGVRQAAPEDMLLIAFSCHGDTDPTSGEYYLFPSDIGPNQENGLTKDLESHSISSTELTSWMQNIDAGEMTMIIDSCHSAAAAGQQFKPGPMDSPGLGQLAYYKRMRILSASAANAVAKEYPDLAHGLLTAALLQDGLLNAEAKPAPGKTALTIGPWLTFAENDVTRLDAHESKPTARGSIQVNTPSTTPTLQRPSLFDFHRPTTPDPIIARVP